MKPSKRIHLNANAKTVAMIVAGVPISESEQLAKIMDAFTFRQLRCLSKALQEIKRGLPKYGEIKQLDR